MVRVVKYNVSYRSLWDRFIATSKNGLFLFYRDYMEYHADRFEDCSFLFFENSDDLVAVMPGSLKNDVLTSHAGLTFGGVITDHRMRTPKMLEIFEALHQHMKENRISRMRYKPVPHIYHSIPAEEDLYALFRNSAALVRRDVSTSIYAGAKTAMSDRRKRGIKKALKHGIDVRVSSDFTTYMTIVKKILNRKYDADPVHSAGEMEMLSGQFPENIRLFAAYGGSEMLAGVIIYESSNVAHVQYIAASDAGKDSGALDAVFDCLINKHYTEKKYFDFGISNEDEGRYLNIGLITQKEEFGARAIVYDTYEIGVIS